MNNKTKVLVTGASGQDGSYMIEHLLATTDYEIVAAVRRTSQFIDSNLKEVLSNSRVRVVHFDLTDPHSITETIRKEQPDFFINFGAQTFVADSWKSPVNHMVTNAMGVLHILEAVKNFAPQCRVYSSGSSEQWGNVIYSPQDITHPMRPRSVYGVSKCTCGLLCKVYKESYGIYVVHGILLNHESKRRQGYFVTRKITKGVAKIAYQLKNNLPVTPISLGNLNAKRDWSDARDFVKGVWLMLNQKEPKDYVLASGECFTIRQFVEKAFAVLKIDGEWMNESPENPEKEEFILIDGSAIVKDPITLVNVDKEFYRPCEVSLLVGDSSPARTELGWKPEISLDMMIFDMVTNDLKELVIDNHIN